MTTKEQFEKSTHAKQWADLTASAMWDAAITHAFAIMSQMAQPGDPAFGSKLTGARTFAHILSNLATPGEVRQAQEPKLKY